MPYRADLVPAYAFSSKHGGMPAGRLAFDLSFFILVTIIGLNVVFGIIVDTFSELRADKNQIAEKMVSHCFICGLRSSDFERFGQGWKHHITKEHHMWDYLYLQRYFDEKDPTEYTFLEQYVAEHIYLGSNQYFPFGRALSLQQMKPDGTSIGADGDSGAGTTLGGVGAAGADFFKGAAVGVGGSADMQELIAMMQVQQVAMKEQQKLVEEIVQRLGPPMTSATPRNELREQSDRLRRLAAGK